MFSRRFLCYSWNLRLIVKKTLIKNNDYDGDADDDDDEDNDDDNVAKYYETNQMTEVDII